VLGEREAAVARELTKLHEEVQRGSPAQLAAWARKAPPKGEMVIIVGPPDRRPVSDETIVASLSPLLPHMRLSEAVRTVAEALGVSRARAYQLALAMRRAYPEGAEEPPGNGPPSTEQG
jgi:16S rRNA (cytidine1402-2'-O)-methyltransferase